MKSLQQHQDPKDTAIEWLVRLQSPQLSDIEQKQFFSWLEESQENQQAYIEAEQLFERAGVVEAVSASNEDMGHRGGAAVFPGKAIYALVASIVLLAGLVMTQFWPLWDTTTYVSEVGERRQLVLSDGSQVILNTDSQIRVKSLDDNSMRVVYLDKGEVFFDVATDKERPFFVQTHYGTVRVLGTQFTVSAVDNDMWVTVVEGKVAIAQQSVDEMQPDGDKRVILVANQRHSAGDMAAGQPPQTVDSVALTSWQQGKLVYNGVSFDKVIKDLNRYFNGELVLGEDELKTIKMVAVLEITDKASTVKALETAFNVVAVQRSDDVTVLYPKK